jgi:hypothetical protein
MKKPTMRRRTEKGTILSAFLSAFFVLATLTVCDAFFTEGIGSPREYRVENINVTIGNLDRWIYRTIGNPPLARQVTAAILNRIDYPDLSPAERAVFQRAGIRLAVESANLGVALLSNALSLLVNAADGTDHNEQLLGSILSSIQRDFLANGGQAAAQDITRLLARDLGNMEYFTDGHTPRFPPSSYFAQNATASEVSMAILVLSLAKLEKSDIDDAGAWDDFDLQALGVGLNLCPDSRAVVVDGSPAPQAIMLAAYLNLINENDRFDDNFLTGLIRGAFFSV